MLGGRVFSATTRAASGGIGGEGPSRRLLLRVGALGGGAALAATSGGVAKAAARTPSGSATSGATSGGGLGPFKLFSQQDLNFQALFALGSAGYGASEVGEVVTTVNEINARGPSYQTFFDLFRELAARTAGLADRELAAGHVISARGAYLRAATYYDACLFFVLGTTARAREADVYAAMQRNWEQATRLFDPPFERVRIPYQGTWLPGYLLRPDRRPLRRPTVILNKAATPRTWTFTSTEAQLPLSEAGTR